MKTKEEIEKEARWRFTDGHGAVNEHSVNVFIEACKWMQEGEDETYTCIIKESELMQHFIKIKNNKYTNKHLWFDPVGGMLKLLNKNLPAPSKNARVVDSILDPQPNPY